MTNNLINHATQFSNITELLRVALKIYFEFISIEDGCLFMSQLFKLHIDQPVDNFLHLEIA